MSFKEKDVWFRVKATAPGLWERVETYVGSGIPDTHYVHGRYVGWVELKRVTRKTIVDVAHEPLPIDIRGTQLAWHTRYRQAGGISWVLAGQRLSSYSSADAAWVFYAVHARDIALVHNGCIVKSIRVYIGSPVWGEVLEWAHDLQPTPS